MNYHCPRPPKQRAFDTSLLMWRRRFLGGSFSPASLFSSGEDGGWYDPSDLTTLFQERTGASATTPAGVGDQVGTILDKSGNGNHLVAPADIQRPVLRDEIADGTSVDVSGQPELLTNGDFSDGTTGWTPNGVVATHSVEDGRYKIVSTNPYPISSKQISGLTVGRWYIASADYEKSNFDNLTRLWVSTAVAGTNWTNASVFSNSNNGSFSIIFRAEATSGFVNFRAGIPTGTGTLYVDNISVREVPASAARRYYLDFDGTDDRLATTGYTGGASSTSAFSAINPISDSEYVLLSSNTVATNWVFIAQDGSTSTTISVGAGSPTYRLNGTDISLPVSRDTLHTTLLNVATVVGIESFDTTEAGWQTIGLFSYPPAYRFDGNWYGTVLIDRDLTTAERENLEIFLANKSGAVLA